MPVKKVKILNRKYIWAKSVSEFPDLLWSTALSGQGQVLWQHYNDFLSVISIKLIYVISVKLRLNVEILSVIKSYFNSNTLS